MPPSFSFARNAGKEMPGIREEMMEQTDVAKKVIREEQRKENLMVGNKGKECTRWNSDGKRASSGGVIMSI